MAQELSLATLPAKASNLCSAGHRLGTEPLVTLGSGDVHAEALDGPAYNRGMVSTADYHRRRQTPARTNPSEATVLTVTEQLVRSNDSEHPVLVLTPLPRLSPLCRCRSGELENFTPGVSSVNVTTVPTASVPKAFSVTPMPPMA